MVTAVYCATSVPFLLAAGSNSQPNLSHFLSLLADAVGEDIYVQEGRIFRLSELSPAEQLTSFKTLSAATETPYSERDIFRFRDALLNGDFDGQYVEVSASSGVGDTGPEDHGSVDIQAGEVANGEEYDYLRDAVQFTTEAIPHYRFISDVSYADWTNALARLGVDPDGAPAEILMQGQYQYLTRKFIPPLWLVPGILASTSLWWKWQQEMRDDNQRTFSLRMLVGAGRMLISKERMVSYTPRGSHTLPDQHDYFLIDTLMETGWGFEVED